MFKNKHYFLCTRLEGKSESKKHISTQSNRKTKRERNIQTEWNWTCQILQCKFHWWVHRLFFRNELKNWLKCASVDVNFGLYIFKRKNMKIRNEIWANALANASNFCLEYMIRTCHFFSTSFQTYAGITLNYIYI